MKTTIQQKLTEIEKAHKINILYSCESGSRGWGFSSPDSDYDVRFIYVRPLDEYLTIQPKKDQLSFPINGELDINGWDLSKVLQLIAKSNTTPFEWLKSSVVYRENKIFRDELWRLCQHYFCSRNHIHHYLGVAKGALETIQGEEIKIKKLFYILRPLLAALWCAERDKAAPMSIYPLIDLLAGDLRKKVLSLIGLKSTADKSYQTKIDQEIKTWIDQTFDYCIEASQKLERKTFEIKKADDFFRKTIRT